MRPLVPASKFQCYNSSRANQHFRHESTKAEEVCRSAKWLMLHVRDCPGTTLTDDVCPFPWCRKVKHLLYHLLSCTVPHECDICSGSEMEYNMSRLRHLNAFRMKKTRNKLVTQFNENESRRSTNKEGNKRVTEPTSQPLQISVQSQLIKEISANNDVSKENSPKQHKLEGTVVSTREQLPVVPASVVCIKRPEDTSIVASRPTDIGTKVDPKNGPSSMAQNVKNGQQTESITETDGRLFESEEATSSDALGETIVVPLATASGQPEEQPSESLAVR